MDEKWNEHVIHTDGLIARVLQHEIDHLDGILIIDRASREERKKALEQFSEFLIAESAGRPGVREI